MGIIKFILSIIGFIILIASAYYFANLDTFYPEIVEAIKKDPNGRDGITGKMAIVITAIIIFVFCAILII